MSLLSTDFEKVVLTELAKFWLIFCKQFKWQKAGFSSPTFRLMEAKVDHVGQWNIESREMHFSRDLVTSSPWNEVLEVLKHEMAHQYVSEVLHITNEPPHGTTFYSVCKKYGIDATPKGLVDASKTTATNHIVEKIQRLLALAKSNNENEARLAADTAHNMMLKYNIEVQEKNEERGYTTRFLGGVTGRVQGYMCELANLLSKFYFVEIIWASSYDPRTRKRGSTLEISGTKENVEVAEYVHKFLSRAALEAWDKKHSSSFFKAQIEEELEEIYDRAGAPHSKKGYVISARSNFLLGFIRGFRDQLKRMEQKEIAEGIVLARDIELEAFYRARYPSVHKSNSVTGYNNNTWRDNGWVEGNSLNMPAGVSASKSTIPLLKG